MNMKSMPLYRRFIGSFRDKVLILILFIIGFSIVEGTKKAETKSIAYLTFLVFSPSAYSYTNIDVLYAIDYGHLMKYSPFSDEEIQEKYENVDAAEMVKCFDLTITFSFIILNILYYLLSEIFLGASIGKYRMKGRLVDNLLGERISIRDAFKRAFIRGLLMTLFVGIRFLFDTNYIIIIILYFLLIDIPVFIKQRSLIDLLTKVTYLEVDQQSSIVVDKKGRNESKMVEEKGDNNPSNKVLEATNDIKDNSNFHFTNIFCNPFSTAKDNPRTKKAWGYIYLLWLSINIIALACGMTEPHSSEGRIKLRGRVYTSDFYPFQSNHIGSYDFSEFIVYTIAIPLFLFAMIKLYRLFVPQKTSN